MKKNLLYVVGIGPGAYDQMTVKAVKILESSQVIVGYTVYVDLIADYFPKAKQISTPMMKEVERCQMALQEAEKGQTVAMVCSGDPGIYAMASLVLELAKEYPSVTVEVIPGITAACAGGALLGAPLGHDFAIISLSDLLTPKELIEKRIVAAAESDLVICFYNPSSKKRSDYLRWACEIILKYQPPNLYCGITRNIGREDQSSQILPLDQLKDTVVDMFSTVFIGNSNTLELNGSLITPRGYRYV